MKNKMKQKLQSGQAVAGTCLYLNNPDTLKAIADVGFDFLLIDTQHSGIGPDTLSTMLSAISHTESEIIVRVIWNNNYLINQALDWGADGIVVPLINTAADAERAIQGAKYPPQGARSWGPNPRGRYSDGLEYWKLANKDTMVLPQIETAESMENIDSILQVDGIDGIMVGPTDLSLTAGLPQNATDEQKNPLIQRVLDKCKEHKVPWGMFTGSLEVTDYWLSRGGQIGTVGADAGHYAAGLQSAYDDIDSMLKKVN
tara:strand:+ start:1256 stop:2026 length:771 start_codon:yes stop_codon:yes gene_type:complete